jgi:hypothetical protein
MRLTRGDVRDHTGAADAREDYTLAPSALRDRGLAESLLGDRKSQATEETASTSNRLTATSANATITLRQATPRPDTTFPVPAKSK